MQLQALAEAAARDQSAGGIGTSSSNSPTERITERFASLPAWALVASGMIVGSMILFVIWGVLARF